ncbi:MAG: hypothetical protein FWH02_00810 [Oscillospiraceae bacterium]|nr:hypothetical protein [Oscillospiraceae bacterium]
MDDKRKREIKNKFSEVFPDSSLELCHLDYLNCVLCNCFPLIQKIITKGKMDDDILFMKLVDITLEAAKSVLITDPHTAISQKQLHYFVKKFLMLYKNMDNGTFSRKNCYNYDSIISDKINSLCDLKEFESNRNCERPKSYVNKIFNNIFTQEKVPAEYLYDERQDINKYLETTDSRNSGYKIENIEEFNSKLP